MIEVVATGEFEAWFLGLDDATAEDVAVVIGLLEVRGVTLGYPYSSDIKDSRVRLRELRIQSKGDPIRVLYAFDPKRQAVLLVGGDKTGDDRFYQHMIPLAERVWRAYLEETGQV